jgi:6-phosphogluconate dehydrogenase
MELGMVGLGRMGANMARRLRRFCVSVAAYNRTFEVAEALERECGIKARRELAELVAALSAPRAIWLMLPAGDATQSALEEIAPLLDTGDILIDGANSYYKDSMLRAAQLKKSEIYFIDAGVSGGVWGLEHGYALMVGGESEAVERIEPFLKILAPSPDAGWLHCGPSGSGHFVKMVHNGVEYGMMQAYAEGLALMKARDDFALDLAKVTEMWRHGSVVRSWLLDLIAGFLADDMELAAVKPYVADSGEGRWSALEAVELGVPAPVMSLALMMRFATQGSNDYAARLLATMREAFGGHAVRRESS